MKLGGTDELEAITVRSRNDLRNPHLEGDGCEYAFQAATDAVPDLGGEGHEFSLASLLGDPCLGFVGLSFCG